MRFKYLRWAVIAVVVVGLVVVYGFFDPYQYRFFPKCPFRSITGLLCPGCGSQRAVHDLLHLDLSGACRENLLLVLFIPYLIAGVSFQAVYRPGPGLLRWRKILFGHRAILIVLAIILLFWLLRNLL